MKRSLSFICAALMLLSLLLASCGGNAPAETSKGPASETESSAEPASEATVSSEPVSEPAGFEDEYRDADGKYVNKKQVEFDEAWKERKEFRVLVYSNHVQTTYFSEEVESLYETTDDKIREAVDTRNKEIEDKYGITIKAVAVDNVAESLRTALADTPNFDAAMPFMSSAAVFAQDGNLLDLCDFEGYLDIKAPWWDQNANDSLSIADKIYFSTGDISIMQKIVTGGFAFNKKLMSSYFPDVSLYELVDNGEWTMDKFYEMCKEVTHPLTDDGVMDENDFWGTVGAGAGLYFASGEKLCTKDSDGYPIVAIGADERSVNVASKVLGYISEKRSWNITAGEFTVQAGKWDKVVQMFGEDQVLFCGALGSAIKKFRKYDVVFGMVPQPKYDKEQDGYFTRCSSAAYGACIPVNVEDPNFSAYMLDLMAVGGKNYLTKAYYDATLKGKDANTVDDERMLDIIYGNILYDISNVYQITELENLLSLDQPDKFSQQLQSAIPAAEAKLAEIVERYESN